MRATLTHLFIVALILMGCSSDPEENNGGTADTGGDSGGTIDATVLDLSTDLTRPASCADGPWVATIQGQVVDDTGTGVGAAKVQLCARMQDSGTLRCITPADTGDDGVFGIVIPDETRCMEKGALRVMLPVSDYATTYFILELEDDEIEVELANDLVLFPTTTATTLPDEGDGSQERTVVYADGLEIDVTPDDAYLGGDGYSTMAASFWAPSTAGLDFLEGHSDVLGVYAFSPEGNIESSTFPIRIPNNGLLTADQCADLYVLGGLNCALSDGEILEEGELVQFGIGQVEGDFIEAEGDYGLPCFTFLVFATHSGTCDF